jgi:hypothetical protein
MEQVMQERGYRNLEGDYRFEVKGDCEGAKAWWAALGGSEQCQDPVIHQDKMEVTVIHSCSHEGRTVELEQVGKTLGDAVVFVEELNSDLHYLGNISDGVITLHVDAERVLASWPSFEKAPTRKALKSCAIVMTPKSIQTNTD